MPRGGWRPGAGRKPKGARPAQPPQVPAAPAAVPAGQVAAEPLPAPPVTAPGQQTPLEYMLDVMNDPTADPHRRDRMAVAAAQYMHRRSAEDTVGKREQAQAAAEEAARGRFAPRTPPRLVVSNG